MLKILVFFDTCAFTKSVIKPRLVVSRKLQKNIMRQERFSFISGLVILKTSTYLFQNLKYLQKQCCKILFVRWCIYPQVYFSMIQILMFEEQKKVKRKKMLNIIFLFFKFYYQKPQMFNYLTNKAYFID